MDTDEIQVYSNYMDIARYQNPKELRPGNLCMAEHVNWTVTRLEIKLAKLHENKAN